MVPGPPPTIRTPWGEVPTLPSSEWLHADDHVVILAHDRWNPHGPAKTGTQVLSYADAHVVAVVDPSCTAPDAGSAVRVATPEPVPLRATLAEARDRSPHPVTKILVGIAPIGGALPQAMRSDIESAIKARIPVIAGLHEFLTADPTFAPLAIQHDTPLVDLRRVPEGPRVLDGSARRLPVPVVTTAGSDCACGKMTTAVALRRAAREAGIRLAFVATGQTGLLLAPDAGAPIDRCIADFAAGEVERLIQQAARLDAQGQRTTDSPDLIVVEGQGALSHPAYSGVTAAILHGSWPTAIVLCHEHERAERHLMSEGGPWPVPDATSERTLIERFLRDHTGARVAAISLATPELDEAGGAAARVAVEDESGVPVFDVMQPNGARRLLDTLTDHLGIAHKAADETAPSARDTSAVR